MRVTPTSSGGWQIFTQPLSGEQENKMIPLNDVENFGGQNTLLPLSGEIKDNSETGMYLPTIWK